MAIIITGEKEFEIQKTSAEKYRVDDLLSNRAFHLAQIAEIDKLLADYETEKAKQ